MTLVLTELSSDGIAMVADSAVTMINRASGAVSVSPTPAKKLQYVPYLNAGVSCWGMGRIGTATTDDWLSNFISSGSGASSIGEFASALACALQAEVGGNPDGECRLGFHVAGFETYNGSQVPSFFHVHDGPSSTLAARGIKVDPKRINANHDVPPDSFGPLGRSWITRNGDYQLYAALDKHLSSFFGALQSSGIIMPHSTNVSDRADYLVFQARLVADIYRLSNLHPGIGGPIEFLAMTPSGGPIQGTAD